MRDVVITGTGVISPIGIGVVAFWESLCQGHSGVRRLSMFDGADVPSPIGGEVLGFDPRQHIQNRKSLKVMSRDIQLGFAAADQAMRQSGLDSSRPDPERFGIVFGADMIFCELEELTGVYRQCMVEGEFRYGLWGERFMSELYPLWMLKYLPNMPACHIGIFHDARGPSNSITLGDVSSLAAISEAVRVIQRGQADAMIAGGTSSRIHPTVWTRHRAYEISSQCDDPAGACRPFDADRDGMVHGEGAAAFVLEAQSHAEARGAKILARILGFATMFEPRRLGRALRGEAIRLAIGRALDTAGLRPADLGHVNAHGLGTRLDDQIEAQAIRDTLGDVPVTAPKSYFGNLAAGAGAVEMLASVLSFERGQVPPTLNYHRPDPACPVHVLHGSPRRGLAPVALVLNHARSGQAVAMVLAGA